MNSINTSEPEPRLTESSPPNNGKVDQAVGGWNDRVAECDEVAGLWQNPDNPEGFNAPLQIVNGKDEAVFICDLAVRNNPAVKRFKINLVNALFERGAVGDRELGRQIADDLVRENYPVANFFVGYDHLEGFTVNRDRNGARIYFELAADAGFRPARTYIAFMDAYGLTRQGNRSDGMALLKQFSALQDPLADYFLGSLLLAGNGGRSTQIEGLSLLERAGNTGISVAFYTIGSLYRPPQTGRIPVDINRAIEYLNLAADNGFAKGYLDIGYLYLTGEGVSKNYETAHSYFQKAANLNSGDAFSNLGYMYQHGLFVEQNSAESVAMYLISVELNSAAAPLNLAIMYLEGTGVPVDYEQAAKYAVMSLERGNDSFIMESRKRLPQEFALEIQRLLADRGFYTGALDGALGAQSRRAMEELCNC